MDWTIIVTSLISMCSALGVAYIGHGVKKSNDSSSDLMQEKFKAIEQKLAVQEGELHLINQRLSEQEEKLHSIETEVGRQDEKLVSITQGMERQEAQLEVIDKRLRGQESANLIQQTSLTKITQDLDDNNMRTLRLDLLHAIETDPDNTMVILEMAQKYFVEMHGNCYMSKIFQEWANEHNVSVAGVFNK